MWDVNAAVFCESENSGDRQVRRVFMKFGFSGQDRAVGLPRKFRCQFCNSMAGETEVTSAADVSPTELCRRFFNRSDTRSNPSSDSSINVAVTCGFHSPDFAPLGATGVSPVLTTLHWRDASGTHSIAHGTRIVNCKLTMDYRFWSVTRSPAFGVLSIRRTVGSVLLE